MDHHDSQFAGMAGLTGNLDKPLTDLEGQLWTLSNDLARAVSSYLGLTITVTGVAGPVSLTAWRDDCDHDVVRSSLLIPLPVLPAAAPGSTLILYAAVPGALVDLSADLSFALGEPLTAFILDRHLTDHVDRSVDAQLTGLAEFSQINRAIGVLVACGHTPRQAGAQLWHRARDAGQELHAAAEVVINSAEFGIGPHLF